MNKPALLQLVAGRLENRPEVTPGRHHNCSRMRITFTTGDFAGVDRAIGTAGGGFNKGKPEPLQLSPDAILMVLDVICQAHNMTGPKMLPMWLEAIRAIQRGYTVAPPAEALEALALAAKELPKVALKPIKTQAKRTGTDEITITYERLPRPEAPKRAKARAGR